MKTAHQNVPAPQSGADAANKDYVDTNAGGGAVIFDDAVPGTNVDIRSDRAANQSAIDNTKAGVTNLGSQTGAVNPSATGATANYATIGGGADNQASADYAVVPGGAGNTASGISSIAAGYGASASGQASAAFCYGSASGEASSAVGQGDAQGIGSHAEGQGQAIGNYSHAEGGNASPFQKSVANADFSHSEGYGSVGSGSDAAHAEGRGAVRQNALYAHAEGQQTIVDDNAVAAHAEGISTLAQGLYSHAEGEGSQALGEAAHSEGNGSQAIRDWSHAEGLNSVAGVAFGTGAAAHAEGHTTQALGDASHSEGKFSIAQGNFSHAGGFSSKAEREGQWAHASGSFNNEGEQQTSVMVLRGTTPGGSVNETTLLRFGGIGVGTTDFGLTNSRAYVIRLTAVCEGSISAVRINRAISISVLARCDTGVASVVATGVGENFGDAAASEFSIAASASGANIQFTFATGATTTASVNVAARLEFTEVRFF